jgi:hypothetical protein
MDECDSDFGDGGPLFSDAGSDDDDDAGPTFIVGGWSEEKRVADAFSYMTCRQSEDDDEYDQAYARQTRRALASMLKEADAALFGEVAATSSAPVHVVEAASWHQSLGCLRVTGHAPAAAAAAAASGGAAAAAAAADAGGGTDGDDDSGGSDSDDGDGGEGTMARVTAVPVTTERHCVLPVAVAARTLDLVVAGKAIAPTVPSESAVSSGACEEVFASHGVLEEPLATHHQRGDDGGERPNPAASDKGAKLGLPPRTPSLSITEGTVTRLLTRLWASIVVPNLPTLALLVARALLGLAPLPRSQQHQHEQTPACKPGPAPPMPAASPPPQRASAPLLQHAPPLPPKPLAGAGGTAAAGLRAARAASASAHSVPPPAAVGTSARAVLGAAGAVQGRALLMGAPAGFPRARSAANPPRQGGAACRGVGHVGASSTRDAGPGRGGGGAARGDGARAGVRPAPSLGILGVGRRSEVPFGTAGTREA